MIWKKKKILAVLAALAIAGSVAGCKGKNLPGQTESETQLPPPFESQIPSDSDNSQQVVGKVSSIDGTKITVELGELKSRFRGNGNNDGSRERPDGNGKSNRKERPSDRTRPSGEGNGFPGGMPGGSFSATGGTATYDLSGITNITIENDSDNTPDTIDEIKTGDVIVITLSKDGNPESVTVKALRGSNKNNGDGSGSRTRNSDRDGNRKNKPDRNRGDGGDDNGEV